MSILINPRVKSAYLILLCLVLVWHSCARPPSKVDRAKESFDIYVKALQQDSVEHAKHFWNQQETERYEMYDWQWGYLSFRELNPLYLNYKITNTEERDGYVILQVEWFYREGKGYPLQKDVRYLIEEKGRMVGANSIFVLTRGWLQKESDHFAYHYKHKQDEPTKALLERMDRFYEKIIDFLQVDYQDKINYYKCDSAKEVGSLFNMEESLARSQTINGVVASIQSFVPHEIVHVISYRILPPDKKIVPPGYLDEGLAYYLGGASFFSTDLLLSWAKRALKDDGNIYLDSLIHNPWFYGGNQSAGLLASFAKFIIDTKGVVKLKQLFTAGSTLYEQRDVLERVYGKSWDQLQNDWKEFILALDLPEAKSHH